MLAQFKNIGVCIACAHVTIHDIGDLVSPKYTR